MLNTLPQAGRHGSSTSTKPSYAILTTLDFAANPHLQRWMYERSGAKVTTVAASHSVYISHPTIVARVIEEAAKSART